MRGTIEMINEGKGLIAVRTESDEYSVLDLLGAYSAKIGDVLSGNLENIGSESIKNDTQNELWSVYIQYIHGYKSMARKMIS